MFAEVWAIAASKGEYMIRKLSTGAALLLLAASPAMATSNEGAEYLVRVAARWADGTTSNPSLTVRTGHPATFLVANERYRLNVVATPGSDGRVGIRSEVDVWTPQGLRHSDNNANVLPNGEPSRFAFPSANPATGEVGEVEIVVRVEPIGG